jgi:hypothetical protein
VGLVAGVAERSAGVLRGHHLGKALRFRRVLLVAAAAEISDLGQFGNVGRGVVGVLGQRTVAGFTGHVGVLAGGPCFRPVFVAQDACLLPGEGDRVLTHQVESARPVVPILAERLGDYGAADGEEDRQSSKQNERGSNQMSGITKQTAHYPPSGQVPDPPARNPAAN